MKYGEDERQGDLLGGIKRGRGRPKTGNAKTDAERQAARRARLKADGIVPLTVQVSTEVAAGLDRFVQFKDLTKGEVIERAVRGSVLRKR